MILSFPDLAAVRFALGSSLVPVEIASVPVAVGHSGSGTITVETAAKFPKASLEQLAKFHVAAAKSHFGPAERLPHWYAILPLEPDRRLPDDFSETPVLFELPVSQLPQLVNELVRLGADRATYRTLDGPGGPTAFLRVVGPPYYTLLRAMGFSHDSGSLRGYREHSPGVWIELGRSHPFADRVHPAKDRSLLLHRPNIWRELPEGDIRDLFEYLDCVLPAGETPWTDAPLTERLRVPLRLVPGNTAESAELWIARGNPVSRIDRLVRESDDRLIGRLRFAAGTLDDGESIVAIGAIHSREEPPVLAIPDAVAYRSYWRIPNLFVPVGQRLHPPLRRDVVARLLAPDPDRRVWLRPTENGGFRPESIAENAFRPLADWVEYVVESNAPAIREWIAASEFEFDSFVCSESPAKPAPDRERPTPTNAPSKPEKPAKEPLGKPARKANRKGAEGDLQSFETAPAPVKPPEEWRIRCEELERRFREADGPLDSAERRSLWQELAEANGNAGEDRRSEAAICWLNALWDRPEAARECADGWLRAELPGIAVDERELETRLKHSSPTPSQARATAALILAAATEPVPPWLAAKLPALGRYLDAHESKLPIRAVWLVALRLVRLSRNDSLGLARVRDRLLARLLEKGLTAEQDLPSFLRFAGVKDSERARIVRERMLDIHRVARDWTERSLKATATPTAPADPSPTLAYLDLLFAFGLAKLGETSAAQALVDAARPPLAAPKEKPEQGIVANYLFKAYRARVDDALAGKPGTEPTSKELQDELEAIRRKGAKTANDPHTIAHYVIGRMREQSTVLESHEKFDPYAVWMKQDELVQELVALGRTTDPTALAKRIRELQREESKGRTAEETRLAVIAQTLRLAPRVGADFTAELLNGLLALMRDAGPKTPIATMEVRKLGRLFESALFLAAHFDRRELLRELNDGIHSVAMARPEDQRYELVNYFAGRCLASLRKVGLREEIDRLLARFQDEILKGYSLDQLKTMNGTKPDVWADALQTMLNLAAGWLTFGLVEQAIPILAAARNELANGVRASALRYTNVARAYVAALGQSPAEFGLPRIAELFSILDPARVTNTFTSAPYYSRLHLNLAEEVVLAMVSDDFAMGHSGQRWLDEDELLVRRRIHADMRTAIQAGV
jgi:hypothetical protein